MNKANPVIGRLVQEWNQRQKREKQKLKKKEGKKETVTVQITNLFLNFDTLQLCVSKDQNGLVTITLLNLIITTGLLWMCREHKSKRYIMIKRAPSRNHRSKGIKVKHVLQICLLLGVCFWLIYQVKHSHDKKREFDDKDAKVSVKAHSDDEILKLGRKDLPRVQEAAKNEKHEDEEEDAVEEEEKEVRKQEERDAVEDQEEANKHEEEEHDDGENKQEEQEEENKNEEIEDERRGDGDDELDEQDQEKTEFETDREDEFIDEEKEREGEGDDNESEGNEGKEKDDQGENENSLDDHDHEGVDRNTHVAREEHYKADDASSAVSHDNQIIIPETEKAASENSNENSERNVLLEDNKSNNTDEISGNQKNPELKYGEGEMSGSGATSNETTPKEKDHGAGSYNSQDHSPLTANNSSTEGGTEVSNNSTGLSTEMTGSSVQNGTEIKLDANPTPAQNVTLEGAANTEATDLQTTGLEQANNSNTASNGHQFDPNTTVSTKSVDADAVTGDSFDISTPAVSETVIRLNASADGEVSSGSSAVNETASTTQNEMSYSDGKSGGTNESSDSSSTEGTVGASSESESGKTNESSDSSFKNGIVEAANEDRIDSSDSSVLQDDRESRIDLGTLPDIRSEVENVEDAAAE
ncbi:hypothetical protein CUMW_114510 [Citrus unshiu]|nr:hypothetical protein CUMW_114510 [Citrus unshiu]